MTKLEYTFKNDTLFKMVFDKYRGLLKRLVAELLGIPFDSIEQFEVTNTDMPPDVVGDKFCRLDITMTVNGQLIDIEIQVANEGNYIERVMYLWARLYSSALGAGEDYSKLPRTIIISIIAFKQFNDSEDFYSEFDVREVRRHTRLTDRFGLYFFELPKLPDEVDKDDALKLWLALFNAETEEDLEKIKALEVSVMNEAIQAYREVSATNEFRELERLRSLARHNEATALYHARNEGRAEGVEMEREKWQGVVAEKDAVLAKQDALIAELRAQLGEGK